jgi:hypothetical protein
MTGEVKPVTYSIGGGSTKLTIDLAERQSVFVVFRKPATEMAREVEAPKVRVVTTVTGPWRLSFERGLGAPAGAVSTALVSWTANSDAGIKYFSGTGTYTKSVTVPASAMARAQKVVLDLGTVRDLAEVVVNGKSVGLVWTPPYTVDVTKELKPGVNQIEVQVTNEFTNRIMGDRLLPADKKILPSAAAMRGMFAPQVPPTSGLLGPVRLEAVAQ